MSETHQFAQEEIPHKAARDLNQAEEKLRNALAEVDAAAVFSSYALYRMAAVNSEQPSKHIRPAPAAIELAAWMLYPEFGRSISRDGDRIQASITALEEYESAFTFVEMFPQLSKDDPDDDLGMHLRVHSGMVRGSGYPIQVVRRIEGVMRSLESELSGRVGVGPCRACQIIRALVAQVEDNAKHMRDSFRETSERGHALAAKGDAMTDDDRAQLAACGDELRRILSTMEGSWAPTRGQIAARIGGITESEWVALTNAVGFTPASRARLAKPVEVQDRPVFLLEHERAFCVHGIACFDAVFMFFDKLCRDDPALRDRYGQCIATWMEAEIERQLQRLFPAASVIRNACFLDPDNPGGETEADVVVIWWPFLIVVDAKGKRVPPESLRGSRGKLKQTIGKNIQDAFIQSRRVVRVLQRDKRIRFKEKATGRFIDVQQERLRRVMPISVTLQNLSGIPTQLAIAQRLGLFKGNAYPWSVCIDDLDIITRFAGSPDVFLHYIERRTSHQSIVVGLHGDEADIFGHYLDNRLHASIYEGRKEIVEHTTGPNFIAFDGGEERFAPFYIADWTNAPSPTTRVGLNVPPLIEDFLSELRNRSDDGARWIAFALLNLSQHGVAQLQHLLSHIREEKMEPGTITSTTFVDGAFVGVITFGRMLAAMHLRETLFARVSVEKYRRKSKSAFGFGIELNNPFKPFEFACWAEGEWRYEPEMSELKRLAWLSLDSQEGQEYWEAMELMGRYAAANHALIHKHVAANLGAEVLLDLENHHNFAWKEKHMIKGVEKEVIVHRKGATPAGQGVLGIIPGSMASPGFVVSGKGNAESLNSASHGAGRVMSRTQATKTFEWKKVNAFLREKGVTLISAGLDEVPMVYKNIHEVMAAQKDLVTILGQFDPKLVKMAPHGERAED
jgi:hypothetical protein